MTVRRDTNQLNEEAERLNTTYAAGTLKVYTGTQPASANDAASGTLLATITLPGTPFSCTNGVATKSGTWSATVSVSGTAGWARMEGLNSANIDFAIGTDITLSDTSLVSGGTITVTGGTITYA